MPEKKSFEIVNAFGNGPTCASAEDGEEFGHIVLNHLSKHNDPIVVSFSATGPTSRAYVGAFLDTLVGGLEADALAKRVIIQCAMAGKRTTIGNVLRERGLAIRLCDHFER